jgi:acyl-CoA synthetase (AMP-forming)/AMP-acid ligase II
MIVPSTWRKTDYLARLQDVLPLPTLEHVIVVDDERGGEHLDWARVLERGDPGAVPATAGPLPDDTCLVIYTSGSSAHPKGVVHTHSSVLASTRLSFEFVPSRAPRFAPNPAGHMGALMALLDAMVHGTHVVFMDAWDPDEAVRACMRLEPAFMPASTPFLQMLLEAEERAGVTPAWPQHVGVGGTTVPRELLQRLEASGRRGFRMYGSSEVPVATSGRWSDPFESRAGTDGRPTLGGHVVIAGADGAPLPPEHEGEVLLRSPQMFCGYVDSSLDEDALTPDGWFRTGDLGTLDADGALTITGRVKDIVIRGGENISAPEVEAILVSHPAIQEATVVGVPDERLGERVCGNVRLSPGHADLELDELRAFFRQQGIAVYKTPELLVIWERDFPRSAEGKIKKAMVRATVLEAAPPTGRVS